MSITKPTDSELEILKLLWENGPLTVKEINNILNESKKVGYTTTLKMMQLMTQKDILSRKKNGKSHIYSTKIKQTDTQKVLLDKLLNTVFGGSAVNLVMQALGNSNSSKYELEQIREYLDKLEGERND